MKEYAGIIVRANNKCLMCKRASSHIFLPNVWSIPSGHVEDGETPIDGAIREFVEETNMEVTNIKDRLTFLAELFDVFECFV
jgi:ADP-ribose pyrophosphatase YjhB (NUDIX family)